MTFIPQIYGQTSETNSFELNSSAEYNANSGTTGTATSTTVVLSNGSATDDVYNNRVIEFNYASTNDAYIIVDYIGSTKTAVVAQFRNRPPTGSPYVIHQHSGICRQQSIPTDRTALTLKLSASPYTDFYTGAIIKILYGAGIGQVRRIKSYTSGVVYVNQNWDDLPDETSLYAIYGEGGLATTATASTIDLDGQQSLIVAGGLCEIIDGTGRGQVRQINSISGNTLSISPDWTVLPDATSRYVMYVGATGTYEDVLNFAMVVCSTNISPKLGNRALLELKMSLDSDGKHNVSKLIEVDIVRESTVNTLNVSANYFRVSLVALGTKISGQLQTTYNAQQSNRPIRSLSSHLDNATDCDIVRGVIAGRMDGGQYQNVHVDSLGSMCVRLANPLTRFGDVRTAQLTPVAQISFTYGISDFDTELFLNPGTFATTQVDGTASTKMVVRVFLPVGSAFASSGAGNYFTLENGSGASFYVWFNVSSGNSDPSPGGTGIEVAITSSMTTLQVASACVSPLSTHFTAVVLIGNILQITNLTNGVCRGINLLGMPTQSGSSVSSVANSSLARLATGTGIGDYVVFRSRRAIKYRPAFGCEVRFSVMFGSPVLSTSMYCGVGNSTGGLFVGYTDSSFQIIRRNGGIHAIRQLKITSVSGATPGVISLWIDGTTYQINITNVSSVQAVATIIAAQNYESTGYKTECIDDTVLFISVLVLAGTGDNKFEFAAGSTNIATTFTLISNTQNTTNYITQQASWNIDRLDGYGRSGMCLNPQRGNIFSITYQGFGFGSAVFSVLNPATGEFTPFHYMSYVNENTTVSMAQPSMQLTSFISSNMSTTPAEMWLAGAAGFLEGQISRFDPVISVSNTHNDQTTSNTNRILMALRTPLTFRNVISQVQIFIQSLTTSSSKSADNVRATISFRLVLGGTPSEQLNYNYADTVNSAIIVAKPTNATLSGGQVLFITSVISEGSDTVNLRDMNIIVQKHNNLYIVYSHATPTNSGDIDVSADIVWVEDS